MKQVQRDVTLRGRDVEGILDVCIAYKIRQNDQISFISFSNIQDMSNLRSITMLDLQ